MDVRPKVYFFKKIGFDFVEMVVLIIILLQIYLICIIQ